MTNCTHTGGVEIQHAEYDTNTRFGIFCEDCGADVTTARLDAEF